MARKILLVFSLALLAACGSDSSETSSISTQNPQGGSGPAGGQGGAAGQGGASGGQGGVGGQGGATTAGSGGSAAGGGGAGNSGSGGGSAGGGAGSGGAGSGGAGSGGAGSGGAGSGGSPVAGSGGSEGEKVCGNGSPFPQVPAGGLDCKTPDDCAYYVKLGCCGNDYKGINKASVAAYTEQVNAWQSTCPECGPLGCASIDRADDGTTSQGSAIGVLCKAGQCSTTFGP